MSAYVNDGFDSGLQLVEKKQRKSKKLVPLKWLREAEWAPVEKTDKPGPSAEDMYSLGVTCRIAAAISQLSKPELLNAYTELESSDVDSLCSSLSTTAEKLKFLAQVCEAVELRLISVHATTIPHRSTKSAAVRS